MLLNDSSLERQTKEPLQVLNSREQQASDQYDCHKWSSSQTGFDPTQAGGGVSPDQLGARRADYQRAMIACLQGRGYSAR